MSSSSAPPPAPPPAKKARTEPRCGARTKAVKTKGRTLLGDDTFNDAIWLTYNLPPLHLVDYGRFVRAWKKEATQRMGIFKGAETSTADDPNSASQVVRRHLSALCHCHISLTALSVISKKTKLCVCLLPN